MPPHNEVTPDVEPVISPRNTDDGPVAQPRLGKIARLESELSEITGKKYAYLPTGDDKSADVTATMHTLATDLAALERFERMVAAFDQTVAALQKDLSTDDLSADGSMSLGTPAAVQVKLEQWFGANVEGLVTEYLKNIPDPNNFAEVGELTIVVPSMVAPTPEQLGLRPAAQQQQQQQEVAAVKPTALAPNNFEDIFAAPAAATTSPSPSKPQPPREPSPATTTAPVPTAGHFAFGAPQQQQFGAQPDLFAAAPEPQPLQRRTSFAAAPVANASFGTSPSTSPQQQGSAQPDLFAAAPEPQLQRRSSFAAPTNASFGAPSSQQPDLFAFAPSQPATAAPMMERRASFAAMPAPTNASFGAMPQGTATPPRSSSPQPTGTVNLDDLFA